MEYKVISADCHIDIMWLEPDLFTSNAPAAMKDRMPHVTDGPNGPHWTSKNGADFGLVCGVGPAGRPYIPGSVHRADRMASTGLYEPEQKQIRRLTNPDLRLADQERDGIQAEVIYGILGAGQKLADTEAAVVMYRIYNDWLAEFCKKHPHRYVGVAPLPAGDVDAAVAEVKRAATLGLRGVEFAIIHDMVPLWHPYWEPLWATINEVNVPLHLHTIGQGRNEIPSDVGPKVELAARASRVAGFQLAMAWFLASIIHCGALERYPNLRVVLGEAGVGWIPYVLNRMDNEWEDRFTELDLTMKPSDYWRRQCKATFQNDRIGVLLLEELGVETVMWGSDFPHPDGVFPDSKEYISAQFGKLPAADRHKIICENAGKLYGLLPS